MSNKKESIKSRKDSLADIQSYIAAATDCAKSLYKIKKLQDKIEKVEWSVETPREGLLAKCAAQIETLKQKVADTEMDLAALETRIPLNDFEFLKIAKKGKLTPLDKRLCYFLLAQTLGFIQGDRGTDYALEEIVFCITSDERFECAESILYMLSTHLENELELINKENANRCNDFKYLIYPTDKLLKSLLGTVMVREDKKRYKNRGECLKLDAVFVNNRKKTERKIPQKKIADVVLSATMREQINKFLWFSKEKAKISWDIKGLGLMSSTALFYGPPGTGKTLLAEAIAGELGQELEKVQYEQLISCYVGESEKNVKGVFNDNRDGNRVLLFDECDALLEARQDAKTSVGRMDNRIINILLQELETYPGLVIFTTNRAVKLDPALERRIMLKLEIRRPEKQERAVIWQTLTAKRIPLAENIDWLGLAEIDLSGGEIKNALLNLAKDPAMHESGRKIGTEDLLRAAKAEEKNRFLSEGKKTYGFVIKQS
jgi:SpoVK/Ycf46/Vps4 family AAA+-type ATPase